MSKVYMSELINGRDTPHFDSIKMTTAQVAETSVAVNIRPRLFKLWIALSTR